MKRFGKNQGEAAYYIARNLTFWGRIVVEDYKDKFSSVRVYIRWGWTGLHDILHPGYHYYQYKWIALIDVYLCYSRVGSLIFRCINVILIPYQKWIYHKVYNKALYKFFPIFYEIYGYADEKIVLSKRSLKLYNRYLNKANINIRNERIINLLVNLKNNDYY